MLIFGTITQGGLGPPRLTKAQCASVLEEEEARKLGFFKVAWWSEIGSDRVKTCTDQRSLESYSNTPPNHTRLDT